MELAVHLFHLSLKNICREPYPSNVSTEEWSLVEPYLLQREVIRQREHAFRKVSNGLRHIVKTGSVAENAENAERSAALVSGVAAEMSPACRGTQNWLAAGCFEALVDDLRAMLRLAAGREAELSPVIIDSTLRFTHDSGDRAGYDGGRAILSLSENAASSSCRDVGSSIDHSHGRPVFGVASKITRAKPKHSRDFTSSPSPPHDKADRCACRRVITASSIYDLPQ